MDIVNGEPQMTDSQPSESSSRVAGLSAYALFFTGVALILLSVLGAESWHWPVWVVHFVRDLGLLLAAVMAGTLLHEKLLRDEMMKRFNSELDVRFSRLNEQTDSIPKIASAISQLDERFDRLRDETAASVYCRLVDRPPGMTGIRQLAEIRRNFGGYYQWVNEQSAQNLFFAGRSVLHRIDADIRARTGATAADVILRRLKEGSKIYILFLDPRIDIIARLADEEGQPFDAMLGDIATSVSICTAIAQQLEKEYRELPPGAELSVRVYDRVPYFAYHKQDNDVIVGFYFDSAMGSSSAAYELIDDETKATFEDHFVRVRSESAKNSIVEFSGARGRPTYRAEFANVLLTEIEHLRNKSGQTGSANIGSDEANTTAPS